MDIALIIHELLIEGGVERQSVCLARALARRGHKVTLYTSAYDRANCFPDISEGFDVKDVGRGALGWIKKPLPVRGYLDMRRLASVVDEMNEIWHPNHWPAQWGALWLKRKLGGTVLWMCNDVPDFYHKAIRPRSIKSAALMPLYWLYYLYDRAQNRKVDLTMLLSKWAESEYKAIYPGPTEIVQPGADPDRFAPGGNREKIRSRFGFSEDEFVLLWLGIFMPHRHLEDAIEAVARLRSSGSRVRLLLAGSDRSYPDYLRSLKQLALRRGLKDGVIFSGKVADEEIRDFYAACDAFLFPNNKQTWGLVVLEAMACGCLTIVSTGAGVHEVLTDGENAILFPPRDIKALTEKIAWLLDSPQERARIASNGMKLVRESYNWDRFADQIEALCNRTQV
jgi:glycosyltransferase involved in cell wall biosynthesis